MSDTDYIPSPTGWVREQVEKIEEAGDTRAVSVMDRPVVMLTMRGAKTGGVRKVPLMRVEHEGVYAGEEREQWWERCVAAYPPYADYQVKTDRLIPVLVLEPVSVEH